MNRPKPGPLSKSAAKFAKTHPRSMRAIEPKRSTNWRVTAIVAVVVCAYVALAYLMRLISGK